MSEKLLEIKDLQVSFFTRWRGEGGERHQL
jgi:hypothetical protein